MNQEENIQLGPIIDANPVPFTMETLGWKIIFGFLAIVLLFLAFKLFRRYQKNIYRRKAVKDIQDLVKDKPEVSGALISQIMFLLKQTALETYGRKTVASVKGEDWLNFLDDKAAKPLFINNRSVIFSAVYKNEFHKNENFNINHFAEASINWIKHHA